MARQRQKATDISKSSRNNLTKSQTHNHNYWSPLTSLVEELDNDDKEYHELSEYKSTEEDNAAAAPSSVFL